MWNWSEYEIERMIQKMQLQVGDVVTIKGKDGRMTVNEVLPLQPNGDRLVKCIWFAGGRITYDFFQMSWLEKRD